MKKTALAIFALAGMSVCAVNIPTGTYIYSGSVLNYKHEIMGAEEGLTIQAVNADGIVLASCKVTEPVDSQGINYILEVPVSTVASGKSAAVGDILNCVILSAAGTTNISPTSMPPVLAANAITNLNIVSASATAYKYGDGTVLVADPYVDGLRPLMKYKAGTTVYDAEADWDGDGADNYEEYVAGTNPFDPSDYLRITAFSIAEKKNLVTFEYAGGHLYTLKTTTSLTNDWNRTSFSVDSPSQAPQNTFAPQGSEEEDIGTAVLYTSPAADSPSAFYRIGVE